MITDVSNSKVHYQCDVMLVHKSAEFSLFPGAVLQCIQTVICITCNMKTCI